MARASPKAAFDQVTVTLGLAAGIVELRPGRGDLGIVGGKPALLLNDLRLDITQVGVGRGQLRFALGQLGPVIAVIDADQNLARRHLLIIVDRDLGDITGDLGADGDGIGLEIGIIGGFEIAADQHPARPEHRPGDQDQRHRADNQRPPPARA
jgi:hypothetical protein